MRGVGIPCHCHRLHTRSCTASAISPSCAGPPTPRSWWPGRQAGLCGSGPHRRVLGGRRGARPRRRQGRPPQASHRQRVPPAGWTEASYCSPINRRRLWEPVRPHHPGAPGGAEGRSIASAVRISSRGIADCLTLLLPGAGAGARSRRSGWRRVLPRARWLAVELLRGADDAGAARRAAALGRAAGLAAGGRQGTCTCTCAARRALQDTLTAIRSAARRPRPACGCIPTASATCARRERLARLYPPELLAEPCRSPRAAASRLDELRYEYPDELVPPGETPASYLRRLTEAGTRGRWPEGVRRTGYSAWSSTSWR